MRAKLLLIPAAIIALAGCELAYKSAPIDPIVRVDTIYNTPQIDTVYIDRMVYPISDTTYHIIADGEDYIAERIIWMIGISPDVLRNYEYWNVMHGDDGTERYYIKAFLIFDTTLIDTSLCILEFDNE